MPLHQENRAIAIETALGAQALALRSFSLVEQLSQPFHIETELRSENGDIDFDQVIGHNATIRLQLGDKATRYFNGFITRLVQVASVATLAHYRATLSPWLWFLTRTADCRIFQDKSVPEILEEVFQLNGFDAYALKLSGQYAKCEYCVQYRETDFNFVSRLMEQEGIYYYFQHENGKHTLVAADSISAHKPFPGYAEIPFCELQHGAPVREAITDWTVEKEVQPVGYATTDFNFKTPKTSLRVSSMVNRAHGAAKFEVFDYPGEFADHGQGERLAAIRLDELQSQHESLHGQASARGLAAGCTFKLKSHRRADQNREYLVQRVTLHADAGEFTSSRAAHDRDFFRCSFAALEKAQQFRPARRTPKPVVQGPQTALVVGPAGEEIHTDKFGRVKLVFHWDRYSKADENSSCWVRVAQAWAGKGWGAICTPRIGQEVIVEFLEGDPDRPIVTGRVYNGDALPPYPLPSFQTLSTLKSNSSKGGHGFNELRFEDKKGEEQIFLHGEKNLDIRIENDAFELIGNDRHLVIKHDQREHVAHDRNEVVGADHKEKIGKDRHLQVAGKEAKAVRGSLSLSVHGDVIEVFGAQHSEQAEGDYYLKAANVVIEATANLTLKVGSSFIAIEAGGISISTPKLEAEGTATVDVKGPLITVSADGMLTLKGGLVKIN